LRRLWLGARERGEHGLAPLTIRQVRFDARRLVRPERGFGP
jgi:hypothetical protein